MILYCGWWDFGDEDMQKSRLGIGFEKDGAEGGALQGRLGSKAQGTSWIISVGFSVRCRGGIAKVLAHFVVLVPPRLVFWVVAL